jgi:hypothetical protein
MVEVAGELGSEELVLVGDVAELAAFVGKPSGSSDSGTNPAWLEV